MRVILVEDQVLLREGLVGLFRDGGHEVVASRGSCDGLDGLVDTDQPDLVVLDIRLPPTYTDEGTRAASRIKAASPKTGVLLLSQHVDSTHAVDLVQLGGFRVPAQGPGARRRGLPHRGRAGLSRWVRTRPRTSSPPCWPGPPGEPGWPA